MLNTKVVVLTPVRNEGWILRRFLEVTSRFADRIIIADQESTDNSREICAQFPKVVVIENKSGEYNELSRQQLLIKTARELVPERKMLLGLDADELLAADAMNKVGWKTALNAEPGTVLFFEKPDIVVGLDQCIRHSECWPLGYIDDGANHEGHKFHSIRIPMKPASPRLEVNDVKILHYAFVRESAQRAKLRFYAVLEAIDGKTPLRRRRGFYRSTSAAFDSSRLKPVQDSWFDGWEKEGIDMKSIKTSKYYWHDFEVLRAFAKHGESKFWRDDVWNFDWESCRQAAIAIGEPGIPERSIKSPPKSVQLLNSVSDLTYNCLRSVMDKLKPRRPPKIFN